MTVFVLRVWVPDRPGALGAVASRIGAVGGDLIGIDILERGAGRAIDELVVDLPEADLVPLLISAVGDVHGVDVEDVRPAPANVVDPRLDALETAALLCEKQGIEDLLAALATRTCHDLEAEWSVVIDIAAGTSVAAVGAPPPTPWLVAFLAGSRTSLRAAAGESGPQDTAWAALPGADLGLVLGRRGRPFRTRERRQLAAVARIADYRWAELAATTAARR
ncbi:MAG: hypothetical protein WKF86_03875 [Acidimicrobiales bacterium]